MRNMEIKARLADPEAARRTAGRLSGGPPQHIRQTDVFFSVPRGRLKLRILDGARGELIEYTRADEAGPRPSEYQIARTEDPQALLGILDRALGRTGTVTKTRDLYLVGQTRIHLDQVEGLGDFLELEVVMRPGQSDPEARAIAQSLLDEFGIAPGDLVPRAYIDLLTA